MYFISSSRFIIGYTLGATLMWLLFFFDYIPRREKEIKQTIRQLKQEGCNERIKK